MYVQLRYNVINRLPSSFSHNRFCQRHKLLYFKKTRSSCPWIILTSMSFLESFMLARYKRFLVLIRVHVSLGWHHSWLREELNNSRLFRRQWLMSTFLHVSHTQQLRKNTTVLLACYKEQSNCCFEVEGRLWAVGVMVSTVLPDIYEMTVVLPCRTSCMEIWK